VVLPVAAVLTREPSPEITKVRPINTSESALARAERCVEERS
jgi:hypothetical protein